MTIRYKCVYLYVAAAFLTQVMFCSPPMEEGTAIPLKPNEMKEIGILHYAERNRLIVSARVVIPGDEEFFSTSIRCRSFDGGETWELMMPKIPRTRNGEKIHLRGFNFKFYPKGWAESGTGSLYRTEDGGLTWEPCHQGVYVDFFLNEKTGWAFNKMRQMVKTTDGGKTWTHLFRRDYVTITSIYFVDENHGWAGAPHGVLLETKDGGTTWTQLTGTRDFFSLKYNATPEGFRTSKNIGDVVINNIKMFPSGKGWAFLAGSGEWEHLRGAAKISGNGKDWEPLGVAVGGSYFFLSESEVVAAQSSGSLFRSDDGGLTWWEEALTGHTGAGQPVPLKVQGAFLNDKGIGAILTDKGLLKTEDKARTLQVAWAPKEFRTMKVSVARKPSHIGKGRGKPAEKKEPPAKGKSEEKSKAPEKKP